MRSLRMGKAVNPGGAATDSVGVGIDRGQSRRRQYLPRGGSDALGMSQMTGIVDYDGFAGDG